MNAELWAADSKRLTTDETELLDCLRKIGKDLTAAGSPVGVVENTLTEIALAHPTNYEFVAWTGRAR